MDRIEFSLIIMVGMVFITLFPVIFYVIEVFFRAVKQSIKSDWDFFVLSGKSKHKRLMEIIGAGLLTASLISPITMIGLLDSPLKLIGVVVFTFISGIIGLKLIVFSWR